MHTCNKKRNTIITTRVGPALKARAIGAEHGLRLRGDIYIYPKCRYRCEIRNEME